MGNSSEQPAETRDKIIKAAEILFAEKGFDGTSVNQIAEKAGVNKPLIYYYFKNKEAILDHLIDTFLSDTEDMAIQVSQDELFAMMDQGDIWADADRLKFTHSNPAEADRYLEASIKRSLDFYWERRRILRIMVTESLKRGGRGSLLFRIADLLREGNIQSVFRERGIELQFDNQLLVERFFIGLMPMIALVLYSDDWKAHYQISDEELRQAFVQNFKKGYGAGWIE